MTRRKVPFILFALIILAGCNVGNAPTEAIPTENTPTEIIPTEIAPTENVPTENSPTDNVPAETELTSLDTWDVVVIGDSTLWGIGELIAGKIEAEFGIAVNLHDYSIANLTAVAALEAVRNSEPDTPNARMYGWPEILKEAEYVILHPSPAESISETNPGDWSCMYPPYYVEDCSPATLDTFQSDLRNIILEIQKLRGDQPVIVRLGSYWARPGNWEAEDVIQSCQACLETYSQAVEEVAGEFGIPFISFLDILNGPSHDIEPDSQGYIGSDNVHISETGMEMIANQIWELGLSPIQP